MNVAIDHTLHEDLIALLTSRLKPANYVEFGVAYNETLAKVKNHASWRHPALKVYAVDYNEPPSRLAGVEYFIKSTAAFIREDAHSLAPFDMLFIDADHSARSVYQDFCGMFPFMSEHGVIFLHDTYPASEKDTDPGLCGDGWRTAERLHLEPSTDIEIVTLPFSPGLSIIRKRSRHLTWSLHP